MWSRVTNCANHALRGLLISTLGHKYFSAEKSSDHASDRRPPALRSEICSLLSFIENSCFLDRCGHEYFVRRSLAKFLDPGSLVSVATKT